MSSRPTGSRGCRPWLDALTALDREIFTILEQDLCPRRPRTPPGHPGPRCPLPHRLRSRTEPPPARLTRTIAGGASGPAGTRLPETPSLRRIFDGEDRARPRHVSQLPVRRRRALRRPPSSRCTSPVRMVSTCVPDSAIWAADTTGLADSAPL